MSETEKKRRKQPRNELEGRQIVGFSLPPQLARDVKQEAARRGMSLRNLFSELWELYQRRGSDGAR